MALAGTRMSEKKKSNPRKITDAQVRDGVRSKVSKMEDELRRNPNNTKTSERLAEMKRIHASKLL
jgi:hypothetical protein